MSDKWKKALSHLGIVFAGAVLALYMQLGKSVFDLSVDDLKALFDAGLSAIIVVGAGALNPKYGGYGIGS